MADRDLQSSLTAADWAESGLMALTGRPGGPGLGPPAALLVGVRAWADNIATRTERWGRPVAVDPLGLVAERAAAGGLRRGGDVSCGGASRLVPCADGWTAVTLARPSDWELVAALLGRSRPVDPGDWPTLASGLARLTGHRVRSGAELLGLPLAVLGERRSSGDAGRNGGGTTAGIRTRRLRSAVPITDPAGLVVADLSSLWAGPLVGRLLHRAGARVVKIESRWRPDGARNGDPGFYTLLNGGKESVALDFRAEAGRQQLRRILSHADVVITAARPRALEQLGLDPEEMILSRRPRVWLSITGYGHSPGSRDRVAFGDDAAVAGGLVAWDDLGPCFCGDAIADPLTGLAASAAVTAALDSDGAWVIEASMADLAGGLTGPAVPMEGCHPAAPALWQLPGEAPAAPLGADTDAVLAGLDS
jgi:crotonobetainyl-CoA:carnitine CoA-transferase CaiB-like acyl-CoA transferase